jgi:hypothetical protein
MARLPTFLILSIPTSWKAVADKAGSNLDHVIDAAWPD